jgi:hypothetical protein
VLDEESIAAGEVSRDRAIKLADEWASGVRSYANLGPNPPYTPDVIAIMDAQEVVKYTTLASGLSNLINDNRVFYKLKTSDEEPEFKSIIHQCCSDAQEWKTRYEELAAWAVRMPDTVKED